MPRKIQFETIRKSSPKNAIGFSEIIAERKLIKTQIKLLHIAAFDRDLKKIRSARQGISEIKLTDFYLSSEQNLVVPIQERITKRKNNYRDLASSYLVYLSYLYNIDLFNLYENDPIVFYEIILSLNLSNDIKRSLFILLQNREDTYFTAYLDGLNTPEYREQLEDDKKRLSRELKKVSSDTFKP